MIITQTPLRISFFGGGTDFREFFLREGGCVLSTAIDRYIFVIIKKRFDKKIRVGYTKTELVDEVSELRHELVRECLRKTGIAEGVEVSTMGDIPSEGSGMGSSSTVTVGLLNAMYQYLGVTQDAESLARAACEIEIEILGKPIGIQDQYIAAYGGQRFLTFSELDTVSVQSIALDEEVTRKLNQNLMLFYTNIARKSEMVLTEQVRNLNGRLSVLREMKQLVSLGTDCLRQGELEEFGRLLHKNWQLKKSLAKRITNSSIDEAYEQALKAGALGGKITGAGGGGFLLLYSPPDRQDDVRKALSKLPELPFRLEQDGTKTIFNYKR